SLRGSKPGVPHWMGDVLRSNLSKKGPHESLAYAQKCLATLCGGCLGLVCQLCLLVACVPRTPRADSLGVACAVRCAQGSAPCHGLPAGPGGTTRATPQRAHTRRLTLRWVEAGTGGHPAGDHPCY